MKGDTMQMQMVCCEDTIMREIADEAITRRDVAQSYRLAMESDERASINWARINSAIIKRWGMLDFIAIKKAAHSGECFR